MRISKIQALLLASALMLAACENIGHLTPANEHAESAGGEMPAHFTTFSTGNGSIQAIGPAGEVIRGSYAPVGNDYHFGDVFKAVYGQYSTNPTVADGGTPTVATLHGNKGTNMQCEFYNDDNTGHGFGGCKTETGALYRLQY